MSNVPPTDGSSSTPSSDDADDAVKNLPMQTWKFKLPDENTPFGQFFAKAGPDAQDYYDKFMTLFVQSIGQEIQKSSNKMVEELKKEKDRIEGKGDE